MTDRCLVVSAVNLTEAGPLTILREFVAAACEWLSPRWKIVVFVHNRALLSDSRPTYIEIPWTKGSWLRRMYLEWHGFRRFADELKPDLWLSLHDTTPELGAIRQAVYCHNPMPFYRLRVRDVWLQPATFFFRYFYQLVYRIHLRRNYAVVVQQGWLRDEFRRWTGATLRIIVAHPAVAVPEKGLAIQVPPRAGGAGSTFLYPAVPRVFKNMELLCHAAQYLEQTQAQAWHSQILLTISGRENRYACWLWRKFGKLGSVRFAGRQTAQQLQQLYRSSDCLLFPSRLETWGLPISEAKAHGLPMFVADLAYAHETVGDYANAAFVDVEDHVALADALMSFQEGSFRFQGARAVEPVAPRAHDWRELLSLLTNGLN